MKKIISKLALVGVAVAALCTSCVVEDIQTTFDLAEAVCTVNVKVVYAPEGTDVTSQATISHKYGSASTFTIPTSNKTVAAEALAVTASFKNLPAQTQTVNIGTLLPGGQATYSVVFLFGSTGDIRYEPRLVKEDEPASKTVYLNNVHYAHDGETEGWLYNDTEFLLNGEVAYTLKTGGEIKSFSPENDQNVIACKEALEKTNPVVEEEKILPIQVSAWAAYRVGQTLTTTTQYWEVYKINSVLGTEEKIGDFVYSVYTCTEATFEEKANPGHAAHYQHGHGHDGHGAYDNAGGGIVFGE